jgi:hypothetical protein
MSRLYISDDSMMGRQFGTEGNLKGTEYIANEVRKMGLKPGGTDGYFQYVPAFKVSFDPRSQLTVNGNALVAGTEYRATAPRGGVMRSYDSLQTVYGGNLSDSSSLVDPTAVAGKAVVFTVTSFSQALRRTLGRYPSAAAVVTVGPLRGGRAVSYVMVDTTVAAPAPGALSLTISPAVMTQLFGASPAAGATGPTLHFTTLVSSASP